MVRREREHEKKISVKGQKGRRGGNEIGLKTRKESSEGKLNMKKG